MFHSGIERSKRAIIVIENVFAHRFTGRCDESNDRYAGKILIGCAVLFHVIACLARIGERLTVAFNLFRRIQFYECLLSTQGYRPIVLARYTGHRLLRVLWPAIAPRLLSPSKRIQVGARFSLLIKPALTRTSGEGILSAR